MGWGEWEAAGGSKPSPEEDGEGGACRSESLAFSLHTVFSGPVEETAVGSSVSLFLNGNYSCIQFKEHVRTGGQSMADGTCWT